MNAPLPPLPPLPTPPLRRARSARLSALLTLAAPVLVHALADPAAAQYWDDHKFDCKVALTITPPSCGTWGTPQARQFVHAWNAYLWTPLASSYTPWPQPAGFDEYGVEYYHGTPAGFLGGITNRCFLCYPRYNPPMQAAWLERLVPPSGTTLTPLYALAQLVSSRAYSEVIVDPWINTGPLNIKIQSSGRHGGGGASGIWGRAFAFTEVQLPFTVYPQCFGGALVPMVVSFQGTRWERLYGDNFGYAPIPLPQAYQRNRFFDPITFRATRPDGTLLEEGTLVESTIDLYGRDAADVNIEESFEGSGFGTVSVNAMDVDVRIVLGHPRLTGATGSLFLSIRGGIIVLAEDSGVHDGVLPPVGTNIPLAFAMPLSHSMELDLSGLSPDPFDVMLVSGEGGVQPIEEVAHCPADVNHDLQVTPADVATFVSTWFQSLQTLTLAGDFDGNGFVQPADIAAFVGEWAAAVAGGC